MAAGDFFLGLGLGRSGVSRQTHAEKKTNTSRTVEQKNPELGPVRGQTGGARPQRTIVTGRLIRWSAGVCHSKRPGA